MNWFWLVIGIALGAVGQRWLGDRQRQRSRLAEPTLAQSPLVRPVAVSLTTEEESRASAGTVSEPLNARSGTVSNPAEDDWESLWVAYVRALERAQFQGGFLARVAHELRSPLSSLMGLQQLILADLCDDPEEERQCVAQSYEAAQNLHSLMDQLIRVAKLEQGSQRLDIQPLALGLLLEDVESFVQLQVADRNARLQLQLPSQPIYAKADYNSLRQILIMLVEAALSQRACEIRVTLIPDEAGVMLNFWADQPLMPLQELKAQLQDDSVGLWEQTQLIALKQSLAQKPEGRFVPHRLSPGMVLLISQLMLDLNGGRLELTMAEESVPGNAQGEAPLEETGGSVEPVPGLKLWLPSP